jgi:hypothetical protein
MSNNVGVLPNSNILWLSAMILRLGSSTKTPLRLGKGRLYGPRPHPEVTPEEAIRITKRRVQKAERDERMDITLALTPVKT